MKYEINGATEKLSNMIDNLLDDPIVDVGTILYSTMELATKAGAIQKDIQRYLFQETDGIDAEKLKKKIRNLIRCCMRICDGFGWDDI